MKSKHLNPDLTRSEWNVYKLTITGLSNKEIGTKLSVVEKTVKFHLTNIYAKYAYKNRAQLISAHYRDQGFR